MQGQEEAMNFVKELFSDGERASLSRMGSFVALVAGIAWVTKLVWTNHGMPDLLGLTAFVCGLYGLGKAGETIKSFSPGASPKGGVK
jgi:hypothetical protein